MALVGFPERADDAYNAAAVLADGRIQAIYRKVNLPNYGVFDELRYFQHGPGGATIWMGRGAVIHPGGGAWPGGLLVPLALLLLTLGLWLLPRSAAALRAHTEGLVAYLRHRMLENRWGVLLVPVALLGLTVFGVHPWTFALVLASVVTVARWPVIAADLVPVLLTAFAVRGFMIAAS